MLDQIKNVPRSAQEILGDLTAIAEQLGTSQTLEDMPLAAAALSRTYQHSEAALVDMLRSYTSDVLVPHDLPAVWKAFNHAAGGQTRELVGLDQQLSEVAALAPFATASSYVGRTQLRRLRPLRTERVLQRYLAAVDRGEAKGFHTIVFGLVLAVYSLPPRQGLIHFAHRTLEGFVAAAGGRTVGDGAQPSELVSVHAPFLAEAVQGIISNAGLQIPASIDGA